MGTSGIEFATVDVVAVGEFFIYKGGMSVRVIYEDGVFKPLEKVTGMAVGEVCRVFSDEQLITAGGNLPWLRLAEKSFEFWDNEDDAVYDTL